MYREVRPQSSVGFGVSLDFGVSTLPSFSFLATNTVVMMGTENLENLTVTRKQKSFQ